MPKWNESVKTNPDLSTVKLWMVMRKRLRKYHASFIVLNLFHFYTLRHKQNDQHSTVHIFKCISLNETFLICNKISLKYVWKGPIDSKNQHWFRLWTEAWQHQAITKTNIGKDPWRQDLNLQLQLSWFLLFLFFDRQYWAVFCSVECQSLPIRVL